ncbi:urease accessory protein UreD [Solemya velum gill symbiont]|uniref:urease accessory protein UreD n=1 Tax=Solemya velum gill symbiont TaxID=2340 RepID=UPI000998AD7D|nr:urease accessory protein UreD [Solemya velum gill symbiont]OOZ45337.1 urease accessory protein [Solemya velum gill symbiont]OOZ47113.1 urease accessory protein [Solemya velum gill symbiont]OOZ49306.1 urease accessory protein [Solemya velum gill symbiont]OOZ52213.1 urease accessory protein [Solemya velum gill symbiont]OOZ54922.1 urease accessory protein [Solemya velum gill symbiont]
MGSQAATTSVNETGWAASLRLGFEHARGKTVLRHREQRGPLAVQRTFHPEGDVCHLYLLHPPGGVVGGDRLEIEANLTDKSAALITTPGATKFYRSAGAQAKQIQNLAIDSGSMEWFPQENIFFPGARIQLSTTIHLNGDAHFIGWEINSLGRPTVGERFEQGEVDLRLRINRDQRPLLIDRLVITDIESQQGTATLRDCPVVATMLATTATSDELELARKIAQENPDANLGFTLVDGLLVGRYLGESTEKARNLFIQTWMVIRPSILGRDAVAPRIWAT